MAANCVLVLLVVWRLLDRLRYYLTALALPVWEAVPPPLQGLPARLSDGTFSKHERKYIGSTGPSSFGACPLIPDSDRIPGIVGGPVRAGLPHRKQDRYSPSLEEAKAAFKAAYLGWKAVARERPP
jgi:hypothetical protein